MKKSRLVETFYEQLNLKKEMVSVGVMRKGVLNFKGLLSWNKTASWKIKERLGFTG